MKYPLQLHSTGRFFPASGDCGYCGKSNDGRFLCMSFSAMEEIAPDTLVPADVVTSFRLSDHGVTKSGVSLTVFQNATDAYFCSTDCLRSFFNQLVTDLDEGVA